MLTRRLFLTGTMLTLTSACAGGPNASMRSLLPAPGLLGGPKFVVECGHTQRQCVIEQYGDVTREEHFQFSSVARDWREDEIADMDTGLIDLLKRLSKESSKDEKFFLLSGYRTAKTNRGLDGAASNSYHMRARAMDLRHSDMDIVKMRDWAVSQETGGVGYYPSSNFVHLDTGGFRTW
jgi:uncharacterized protein YcbK (DUF882 family)